jgi:hypothetical protein
MQVSQKYGGFKFKNSGFEFYVHPPAASYALNRLLFDVRHDGKLRSRIIDNIDEVAQQYNLDARGVKGARALIDVGNATIVSDYAEPLVEAGAHPLQALMSLHVMFSTTHKARKAQKAAEEAKK